MYLIQNYVEVKHRCKAYQVNNEPRYYCIFLFLQEGPHSCLNEEEFFDAVDASLDKLEKEQEEVLFASRVKQFLDPKLVYKLSFKKWTVKLKILTFDFVYRDYLLNTRNPRKLLYPKNHPTLP